MTSASNALIYSSIKNNLTTTDQLNSSDYGRNSILLSGSTLTDQQVKDQLDNILDNTTVKRACCLEGLSSDTNSWQVPVRIPIPPDLSGLPSLNTDFGYYDVPVNVPKTMCATAGKDTDGKAVAYVKPKDPTYSKPCDDFYTLYCANMIAFYWDELTANNPTAAAFNSNQFADYKPECGCYNIGTDLIPATSDLSSKCIGYKNCKDARWDRGDTYLDSKSRKDCPDNITICKQVLTLPTVVQGNVNIEDNNFSQACGSEGTGIASQDTDTTTTNTTDTDTSTTIIDTIFPTYDSEAEDAAQVLSYYVILGIVLLIVLCCLSYSCYRSLRR